MKVLDWENPETQNHISIMIDKIVSVDKRYGVKDENGNWKEHAAPRVQVMTNTLCCLKLFESNEEAQVEYERVLAVIAAA